MKEVVIFDIDGCLADDRWRRGKILPGNWDAYHAGIPADQLHEPAAQELRNHLSEGREVAYVTARPESARAATLAWLERNGLPHDTLMLFMRPDGDVTPSPELKVRIVSELHMHLQLLDLAPLDLALTVVVAYDDRRDVLDAYARELRLPGVLLSVGDEWVSGKPDRLSVPEILREAAGTFEERNAVYGSNYAMVGPIMAVLFPQGVPVEVLRDNRFHLFELMIVKLSRLAISRLTHRDSARDAAVYAAMIEAITEQAEALANPA